MANVAFGSSGAFGADNVYVVVKVPQPMIASGGATFQGMTVGGASWGPLNVAVTSGTPTALQRTWGPPLANNPAPLVQEGSFFLKQQPQGGVISVRVGDGTQAAATGTLKDTAAVNALTVTALYTGTFGNQITVTIAQGSNSTAGVPTFKVIVQAGTFAPEVFDRIGGVGAALWTAMANAINNGQGPSAPASQFITATALASTVAPALASATLAGGLDGIAGINAARLVGVDGVAGARTGMYALENTKGDVLWLAGCTDTTTWATMLAFAKTQNALAIGSLAQNTAPDAAVTAKLAALVDDPYFAAIVNHGVYFDTNLAQYAYVAPACLLAGVCCSLASYESPGNKPVYGLVGTDKTWGPNAQNLSDGDDTNLELAGVTNLSINCPGFNGIGIRTGKNSSSNSAQNEIAWTRKTNDLVRAFASKVMGQFVDMPQSVKAGSEVREHVRNAFNSFLGPQVGEEIDDFNAQCDTNNNPPARVRAGYLQADVMVEYLAIINKFVINLTAGQTVDVSVQTSVPAAQ